MQPLDKFIDSIKTLPPAPRVLSQLLVLLNQDDSHADEIVELITLDPALTAKVLQSCNNAAFGLGRNVSNLDEAVTQVGFNAIYRLVAMVVSSSLLGSAQEGYGMITGDLWHHSVSTAAAARVIAQKMGDEGNVAFTAGLLHDIGKLVLSSYLKSSQESLIEKTESGGLSFLEVENEILGVDHAEVGGRLLVRWNFPEDLVSAVRHHHDPTQARPFEQLAAYVHLGDVIAHCLGQAQGFESFALRPRPEVLEILEIGANEIDSLVLDADIALKQYDGLTRAIS